MKTKQVIEGATEYDLDTNTAKAVKWLLLATSKEKDRPVLQTVHVVEPGLWEATDEYRIHRIQMRPKDAAGKSMAEIMALAAGNYYMSLTGKALAVRSAGKLRFPPTYAVTGGYQEGKLKSTGESERQAAYFCADGRYMTDLYQMPVKVRDANPITVRILSYSICACGANEDSGMQFYAVVMPMAGNELQPFSMQSQFPYVGDNTALPLETRPPVQE